MSASVIEDQFELSLHWDKVRVQGETYEGVAYQRRIALERDLNGTLLLDLGAGMAAKGRIASVFQQVSHESSPEELWRFCLWPQLRMGN